MTGRKYFSFKKLVIVGCFVTAIGSFAFVEDLFQISKNLEIFTSIYKELSINYVDDVNSSKMMKTSIDAMLTDLDPYTTFVQESDMENYHLQYESAKYGGIGISVFIRDGKTIVSDTFEGSPANKADVRAGDEIVQINGIPVKGKNNDQTSVLLKGDKNTPVKILVSRPGVSTPIEKNLIRDEINSQPNVPYYGMLANNIGYIKLDRFLENSAQDVKNALVDLQRNNLKGLILDLRNNGGGILQESVKIINLFVDRNITVVTQKGRNREKTATYKTQSEPLEPDLPMVVLINKYSASASEIVAGSLQDQDRAVIIGQRSYGKGLVQETFKMPYNTLVKITIAKYYTPSGRCIQALDYTHRTEEGNVERVSDSLITEYKTRAGRSVYDGSGIYPDIFIAPPKKNMITQTLESKFFVFDYATKFRNSKPSIPDAKSFKMTDAEYADFINYLADKDYNYNTQTEVLLGTLKTEAEKENKLAEIKTEYEALKNKVSYSKKNDLTQFKDEIRRSLENEIAARYYFQKGRIENSFKYDEEMSAALKTLENRPLIVSVLRGEGSYKSIGKPGVAISTNN